MARVRCLPHQVLDMTLPEMILASRVPREAEERQAGGGKAAVALEVRRKAALTPTQRLAEVLRGD